MLKGELQQNLLDQSNRSFVEGSSLSKSVAQYSIIQAMLEMKMKEHSVSPGEMINSSIEIEDGPKFLERGPDFSSKDHDNENILYSHQKPSKRMSHVYPSYMSENSIQIDHEKIEKIEHTYPLDQLEKLYKTSMTQGLSEQEAQLRRNRYGINKIKNKQAKVSIKEVLNLLTLALVCTIILSIIGFVIDTKEHFSFFIEIICFLTLLALTHLFTIASYLKKKKLFESFNQIISSDEVIVIRSGTRQKISSTELVKGDLIELNQNTKVPADCRIIQSEQLSVDNFLFTGDSQPILLECEESNHKLIFEARNVAFLGAGIVFGEGKAIVTNTGNNTLLGKLAKKVEIRTINSHINDSVKKLITITFWIIICFIVVTLIGWTIEEYNSGYYNFTFLINTIIIIILSNLPFTLMLMLSYSKRRIAILMQDQDILLKDVDVIENLTSMNLLIVNKESLLLEQQKIKKMILNNRIYSINKIENQQNLLNCIYYCVYQETQTNDYLIGRQSVQCILQEFIKKYKIEQFKIIQQKQFTAMEKYSLTIVQNKDNTSHYIVYIMGAPEVIASKLFQKNSFEEMQYMNEHQSLASQGYSLISFAAQILILDPHYRFNTDNSNQFNFNCHNLEDLGTLAFKIQVKPVIKLVLQKLKLSGIRVVLMTGDFPQTACALAKEAQLIDGDINIVKGEDLEDHQEENDEKAKSENQDNDEQSINTKLCTKLNTIYARINPAQKLMVISAFQKFGYKIGLIGFDTIDSPALRKADVSFALSRSDELAKQSAQVVLIGNKEHDLEQILKSVYQGRRFTDNLIKQIKLSISNKFGQFIPILLMLFGGIPLPLTSFGILYITLVLDILVFNILYEKEEIDIPIRIPGSIKIFSGIQSTLRWILTHGVLAASSGMLSYFVAMHYFGFSVSSLPHIIYKQAYPNQIYGTEDYYKYNNSSPYLGNENLLQNPQPLHQNQFVIFQFYKHFSNTLFDFRNSIVYKQENDIWSTNFHTSDSDLCKSKENELCYSILSLDIAQLGFIYGFIIWGWFHVFLSRSKMLSFRYQQVNKRLFFAYIISGFIILGMYIPYMIFYFPDNNINFFGVIGIPCVPILVLYFILNEITAYRKLTKVL